MWQSDASGGRVNERCGHNDANGGSDTSGRRVIDKEGGDLLN